MSDYEKIPASVNVSDSSKKLPTTSENIPFSEHLSQALLLSLRTVIRMLEDEIASATPQEITDDILMFSEFPLKEMVTAIFSESSDPPVHQISLRINLEGNVTAASEENMLVEPSQLNRSPWNFVINFRPAMHLKFAIKALSNPKGSGRIDFDDNGFNITVQKSSASANVSDSLKKLPATSENIPFSEDMSQALPPLSLGIVIRMLEDEISQESTDDILMFSVFPFKEMVTAVLSESSDEEDRSAHLRSLRRNLEGNVTAASQENMLVEPSRLNRSPQSFVSNFRPAMHLKFAIKALSNPEDSCQGSRRIDVDDNGFNITVQNLSNYVLARFRCTKPLYGKKLSFLALSRELTDVKDTVYLGNHTATDKLDIPVIIELARTPHFRRSGGGVPALVGQANQQAAGTMIGGLAHGLGMGIIQGGPHAIPLVAHGGHMDRYFQILNIKVASTEDSNANDYKIIQEFVMPENHSTSWGWLAQLVYDTYLTINPNQPIEDGTRLNPYVCWPRRSVSYTSLAGELFVWPNTPWQTVKYHLKNITIRGGWV